MRGDPGRRQPGIHRVRTDQAARVHHLGGGRIHVAHQRIDQILGVLLLLGVGRVRIHVHLVVLRQVDRLRLAVPGDHHLTDARRAGRIGLPVGRRDSGHRRGEVGDGVPAFQHQVQAAGVGHQVGEQMHALLEGAGRVVRALQDQVDRPAAGMIGEVVHQVGQHGRREAVQVTHLAEQRGERRGAGTTQQIQHVLEFQRTRPGRRLVGHLQVRLEGGEVGGQRGDQRTGLYVQQLGLGDRRSEGGRRDHRLQRDQGVAQRDPVGQRPRGRVDQPDRLARVAAPATVLGQRRPVGRADGAQVRQQQVAHPGQDVRALLRPDQQPVQVGAVGRGQRRLGEPVGLHRQRRHEIGQRGPGCAEQIRRGVPVHCSARDRVPHDHQPGHRGIAGGALQPDQPVLTRGARSSTAPNAAGRSAALAVLVVVGWHWAPTRSLVLDGPRRHRGRAVTCSMTRRIGPAHRPAAGLSGTDRCPNGHQAKGRAGDRRQRADRSCRTNDLGRMPGAVKR